MNNDLISRSALKECIKKRLLNGMIIGWLFSIIDTAPAVDAVEVCRCKDCKHWEDGWLGYCTKCHTAMHYDGFCSNGERREDG